MVEYAGAMNIHLIVQFKAQQAHRARFIELLQSVKTSLPGVPGCRGVQVYQDLQDPLAFTVVESWDSQDLHAAHLRALIDSGQWAVIAALLATEPVSRYQQAL